MKDTLEKIKSLAQNKSLLIVEDDATLLLSLSKLLAHFFAKIYTASNPQDALKIYTKTYKEEHFLVLSDINLGSESGVDLSYALRTLYKKQRIIAISAVEKSSVFIDSIECGIDRFLLKPIKKENLFATLLAVLEKIEYDLELEQSQRLLEESREYALKLLEEQDQFVKNAIHEIHTPLAIIITNIDLLRMQGVESESLQAIEAGSRAIENSYEDMTYLMKREQNIAPKMSLDLLVFVEQRCDYFETIAKAHAISFSLSCGDATETYIKISPTKLARLVDNTLSNAIKYASKPSKVDVEVGVEESQLFFAVRNYGVVIQDTQKIFERFYRESQSRGGYGLGLHIVSMICAEENITVEIDSDSKNGTRFAYKFQNAMAFEEGE